MIGEAVSEKKMFKEGHKIIHVYSPRAGADNPMVAKLRKHKSSVNLVICCKFFPLNDFITVFQIQTHSQPN